MLYGNNADEATARKEMPFMIPVYNLLEKYAGKVIYVKFLGSYIPLSAFMWNTCPEMNIA